MSMATPPRRAPERRPRRVDPAVSSASAPHASPQHTVLAVRVRPKASRAAVGGTYPGPHGPALVVAVSEPAVDGRATQAVLAAVAKALGLPRSRVLLRAGERSRDKLLTIVDPPADLADRVQALGGPAATDGPP